MRGSSNGLVKNQESTLQLRKPFSNIENLPNNNVLGEITNKLSSREEKSRSFTSNQRPNIMNKENNYDHRESFKSKENKAFNR